jgi:two-component system, OmpR family, sensor histidine kinase KdpD
MLSSGRWLSYLIAFGLVAGTTLIGKLLQNIPVFDPISMSMLYILSAAISAAYLGSGPSIMISFLSVIAFDFFFIPPVLTFVVTNEQHSVTLLIMFIVSFTISCLSPRIRL